MRFLERFSFYVGVATLGSISIYSWVCFERCCSDKKTPPGSTEFRFQKQVVHILGGRERGRFDPLEEVRIYIYKLYIYIYIYIYINKYIK